MKSSAKSQLPGAASQLRAVESFLTVLCPTCCCVGIGLIAFGARVFAPQSGFFQLGVNAVIVSVLVLIARRWSSRRFLAVGALITIIMTGMTVRFELHIVLHTALLMVMWVVVVFVNVRILSQSQWVLSLGQYIAWSFVFTAGFFGVGMVPLILFRPPEVKPYLVFYGQLTGLTGVGLGIGFKIGDWLVARLRSRLE